MCCFTWTVLFHAGLMQLVSARWCHLGEFPSATAIDTRKVIQASVLCLQAAEQRAAAQARGDDGGHGRGRSAWWSQLLSARVSTARLSLATLAQHNQHSLRL